MKFVVAFLAICTTTQAYLPQLDGKIVGGEQVDISDFPYQVSVRMYYSHICGGAIINANTILTAAHCFPGMEYSAYGVKIGNTAHGQGEYYKVTRIIKNSNFNPKTYDNDMAILKLASPISFNSSVQPIPLQPKGLEVPAGSTAWVSGWGVTSEGSITVPTLLRAVDVSVIDFQQCFDAYNGFITSHMLCAQSLNHDACQGDSGGPLVYDNKLIGIVSWGYGCARPEYSGVYADVSAMYDWIIANAN